jgi:pimeloyl-ACP methyl ester carboxylesterase
MLNPNRGRQFFDQDDPSTFVPAIQVDVERMATGSTAAQEQADLHPSFEEQFKATESVESRNTDIKYVKVTPEGFDDNPDAQTIMLLGGWTEGPAALKGTMRELYKHGNQVLAVTHPAKRGELDPIENVPNALLRKVMNYHDVAKANGLEKVNLLAHSAGGEDALVWALLYPEQIQDIRLENVGGLLGKKNLLLPALVKLGARFAPKMTRTLATMPVSWAATRAFVTGSASLAGPRKLLKGATEVAAISQSDISNAIEVVREQGHYVSVNESWADPVIPVHKTRKQLAKSAHGGDEPQAADDVAVDSWSYNIKRRAGHDELLLHPERAASAADTVFKYFKALREGRPFVQKGLEGELQYDPPKIDRSRQLATRLQNRWHESKLREAFVTGEKARRNRLIALGTGAAALAGAVYLAKNGLEMPFSGSRGGGSETLDTTATTIDKSTTPPDVSPGLEGTPDLPAPRGDISSSLNLPDNYLVETPDGYEATAMAGAETDSFWKAAEHALADYLGEQPSVVQIDALQDILGNHFLDVGDTVNITHEQIERALNIARYQA